MASADDGNIIWEDDDPDFALALSLFMDSLESNGTREQAAAQRDEGPVLADGDPDEVWDEDDPDFALALSMYLDQVEGQSSKVDSGISESDKADSISMTSCVVDRRLEDLDPNPDIWKLFRTFDDRFFSGDLQRNGVMVGWSPRMTSCAGLCAWNPRSQFCEIKLSQPLLMLRPRNDLVETLIHEMIHAILFVTRQDDNHESHGQLFHHHMYRINKSAGCNITVYHNFHDEVRYYQKHVWKCNGPCNKRPPYYGIVRRAMNRPPGPKDFWFARHQSSCNGTFVKIEGPEKSEPKGTGSKTPSKRPPKGTPDIRNFFPTSPEKAKGVCSASASQSTQPSDTSKTKSGPQSTSSRHPHVPAGDPESSAAAVRDDFCMNMRLPANFKPFSGTGHRLGSKSAAIAPAAKPLPPVTSRVDAGQRHRSTTIEIVPDPTPIELIELD